MAGGKTDFFGMSDEDFANLNAPPSGSDEGASAPSSAAPETEAETDTEPKEAKDAGSAADTDTDAGGDTAAAAGDTAGGSAGSEPEPEGQETDPEDPDADTEGDKEPNPEPEDQSQKGKDASKGDGAKDADAGDKSKTAADPKTGPIQAVAPSSKELTQEQLAAFYDQVMAPFKANGRMITLRSPEEAIRLMQMGAGYGRKLQDMQPYLKTLRMLEKNNLLDETKLSYLIDLDQKNPEAIKKLIKDSGIDPLDLNIDDNADYRPRDHSVSDNEVAFTEALKEVASQPGGRETIQQINSQWDQTSKDFLWSHPEVLSIIHEQRANGIYDLITAEIDRKKMLGEIAPTVPFLEAYKIAGDALVNANYLNQTGSGTAASPQQAPAPTPHQVDQQASKILGTRTATPKSAASNSDKVKAAASTPSSSRKAKEFVNPLEMADDEFLKQFENRL